MAPLPEPPESFYLAPLDKCLNEGHKLISWKLALEALCDLNLAQKSPNLEWFLLDDLSTAALQSDFVPFQQPTTQTKNDFDTRTAAVNITPSNDGHVNTNQIKEDALWLSKQTAIDEVSALRIVVLEWQNRHVSKVLEGYNEEEAISVQEAIGKPDSFLSSLRPQNGAHGGELRSRSFDSDEGRRARLLSLHLSESEHVLAVKLILKIASASNSTEQSDEHSNTSGMRLQWIAKVCEKIDATDSKLPKAGSLHHNGQFLISGIQALETALEGWESGSQLAMSLDNSTTFDLQYRTSQLRKMLSICQTLFVHVVSLDPFPPASGIQAWFEFVDKFGFFELLQAQTLEQETYVPPIQTIVSLISLQVLRLPNTLSYISDVSSTSRPTPVIHDVGCRSQIDSTIRTAAERGSNIASPAMFAWSIILQTLRQRVESFDEDNLSDDDTSLTEAGSPSLSRHTPLGLPTAFTETVNSITAGASAEADPIDLYARTAVDGCNVLTVISTLCGVVSGMSTPAWNTFQELHARSTLLDLVRYALLYTSYTPEIVASVLSILDTGNVLDDVGSGDKLPVKAALANTFVHDTGILVPRMLHQAQWRYPLEIAPFLKLCNALANPGDPSSTGSPAVLPLAGNTSYFTQSLPKDFSRYELAREDENANGVRLTEHLPIFLDRRTREIPYRRSTASGSEDDQHELFIPRRTLGFVISEAKPFVVAWEHSHSPLKYLGCLLSTVTASSHRVDASNNGIVDRDTQADTISLLAKLLRAYSGPHANPSGSSPDAPPALWVLEEASDQLDRNQDIVSVVYNVFEQELSMHPQQRGGGEDILTSCVHFFGAAMQVVPGRIWPILVRSELLEIEGRGGRLAAIVAATEISSGRFEFLTSCLSLFEAVVHSVIARAVSSKIPGSAITKRFVQEDEPTTHVPQAIVTKITLAFTRTFLDVLQSSQNWAFANGGVKLSMRTRILKLFNQIVTHAYGYDDAKQPSHKLCGGLATAAKYLIDALLGTSESNLSSNSILSDLVATKDRNRLFQNSRLSQYLTVNVASAFEFLTTLLDVSVFLDTPFSHLEHQLFLALPLLTRLYVAEETHKSSITLLLSRLVQRAGSASGGDSESLLGYMGSEVALPFLAVLQDVHSALGVIEPEVRIWDLASVVVGNKQQWFASFLVTGETPKNALKKTNGTHTSRKVSKALLLVALDRLSQTHSFHTVRALAMLRFVVQAQNQWPSVTESINRHPEFFARVTDYVGNLSANLSQVEIDQANQTYAASLIAEVLAMYLHNLQQLGDTSTFTKLTDKLGFFREHAVAVPLYNSSLHANLKRNFETKFPGCSLTDFKRTMGRSRFGRNYFYDLDFAAEVLGFHKIWKGPRDRGFHEEFARANTNMSLVESQVLLLTGWKSLAAELSRNLMEDTNLQKQMASITKQCLVANIESTLPEAIFASLVQTRADLALVITQRLVNAQSDVAGARALLAAVWDAVRASGQDFEIAFVGEKTPYYRTLLKILLLSLQPHSHVKSSTTNDASSSQPQHGLAPETASLLVEITGDIVCKGFQSLCGQLHEDPSTVQPTDFLLLISILQSILRVHGIASAYAQLTLCLCDSAVHRYALSLFSFADRLTVSIEDTREADPIFGELCVSLVRELSSIPSMAEFLATEAILSQLNAAPLLSLLRLPPSSTSPRPATRSAGVSRGRSTEDDDDAATTTPPRLSQLWATGILPLVLNLLLSVGTPFAPEVVGFLNGFSAQLSRAASVLSTANASAMTLARARELHTLAMLSRAIDDAEAEGMYVAAGEETSLAWDKASVRDELETWLAGSRREALRSRVVAATEREAALLRMDASGRAGSAVGQCRSRLEELVVVELTGAWRCLGGGEGGD